MSKDRDGALAINIDEEIQDLIKREGQFGESYNDVLRRLLGLPPKERKPRKERI